MNCKKCGSDALIKKDDWYECAHCGATMFDTDVNINDVKSPTRVKRLTIKLIIRMSLRMKKRRRSQKANYGRQWNF